MSAEIGAIDHKTVSKTVQYCHSMWHYFDSGVERVELPNRVIAPGKEIGACELKEFK